MPSARSITALYIALGTAALVVLLSALPVVEVPFNRLDDALYDSLYRWRPIEDQRDADVVIVAVDDAAIRELGKDFGVGWPWPRKYWGQIAEYLIEDCGARAVAFDFLFPTPSRWPEKPQENDDQLFASAIDRALAEHPGTLVFARQPDETGQLEPFSPPVKSKTVAGVLTSKISDAGVWRTYRPYLSGAPSLAMAAVDAAGMRSVEPDQQFLLRYYGPHLSRRNQQTFRYVSAYNTLKASYDPDTAGKWGIDPAMFRNKIVLVGGIATGLYDLKTTPLGDQYPGVEIQATAMENLIHGDRIRIVSFWPGAMITAAGAWLASMGVIRPRRAWAKVLASLLVIFLLMVIGTVLFLRHDIVYLRLATPLIAAILATIIAFAWSFFGEDRQRRRLLKALSSVVSPHIADELARDPSKLAIGGQRREMTVMFTDLVGFTTISESLPPEKLAPLLNYYLQEMCELVLSESGTLDKYIGDAIMSFWNAPLLQDDHAALACRAALGLVRRLAEIQPALRNLGAQNPLVTRVGINTGPMVVGFTGSSHLANYTVLGDAVNLGSRLEGANKMYGTHIMISQHTADRVKDRFVLRKLDVVRVKGKAEPMAVYELVGTAPARDQISQFIARYEQALSEYQLQRWEAAGQILLELTTEFPEDGPTQALLARVADYRLEPPPADWDGVYVATEK